MRQSLIILLIFFLSSNGFSQELTNSFSLEEAIAFALENNRTSKNAQRDIEAAEKQKWETIATGLPQVNGSIQYQNQIKQQFDQPVDFGEDGFIDFGAPQSVTAGATLTQQIFDGSYIVGLQSTKVFLEISENAKEKTDLEIRKAVINAYGNVLLSEESIKILESNIEVLQKTLYETTKIYENGLEEEESVEQLQITLSSVRNNLANNKRLKDLAYKMFNITIGLDINAPSQLSQSLEDLTFNNIQLNLLNIDNSIEENIDYKIAENDKVSKELLVKLEQSRVLPTLNAFLSGAYLANRESFDFVDFNNPWVGVASFGLNLDIPIFGSGLKSARTQRAKINLKKAENNLSETEQQLKLQIATAKSNYQFAIEDYNNKKENLILAERIEEKNQIKFFEGIGSSFDLRQAQIQLYTAQQELLQTMLNVINTKAELETALNLPNIN